MIHQLATVFLGPLLLYQGRSVRRNTPILPEPSGDRSGLIGNGAPLSLLVLGDSAAAGVGVNEQCEALAGNLVRKLSSHYQLDWKLLAKTGATTASTFNMLGELNSRKFDVVITSLGVNDVTKGMALKKWLQQQQTLRMECRKTLGTKLIIASGLPPVHGFPALPQPLRWYLGRRATEFDSALQNLLRDEADCRYLNLRFSNDASLMSEDGFHPGGEVYKEWAQQAADIIRTVFPGDTNDQRL